MKYSKLAESARRYLAEQDGEFDDGDFDDESGLRRQERYADALHSGSSDPWADATYDENGGYEPDFDWNDFLENPNNVSIPDPDGSLRREIESKYGKDFEGKLGKEYHYCYYSDGRVWNYPPENTIETLYDDGSARVWGDDGRTHNMSQEEMEDEDWLRHGNPGRFPHAHGINGHWDNTTHGQFSDAEHELYGIEGKNRWREKKNDINKAWDERKIKPKSLFDRPEFYNPIINDKELSPEKRQEIMRIRQKLSAKDHWNEADEWREKQKKGE